MLHNPFVVVLGRLGFFPNLIFGLGQQFNYPKLCFKCRNKLCAGNKGVWRRYSEWETLACLTLSRLYSWQWMCVVSALKPKPFSFCLCCASRSPLNTGIPSTMWIVSVCMLLVKASTTAAQKSHSTLAYPPLHIQCAHSNHASNEQAHNEWILLVPLLVRKCLLEFCMTSGRFARLQGARNRHNNWY